MKHDKLTRLILAALFAALTCAATMLIHIPMPATNGYINLGDCVVLLSAFFLGPVYGMAAGGIAVFVWKYLCRPLGGVFGIYELLPAFLVGLLVMVVVSLLTKRPDTAIEREFDLAKSNTAL